MESMPARISMSAISGSIRTTYLTRLGRLVCDFPQISEVDFNPVKGEDENLFVVDCRIII
jgi:hypothetical protein